MDTSSARASLINSILAGRAEWDELLSQVPNDRWSDLVIDDWSVKRLVAHITWYEREMIPVLQERVVAGSEWWNLAHDERNRLIAEESDGQSVDEVRQVAAEVIAELVAEIELLTDDDLTEPGRIRNLPYDWTLWQVLHDNTVQHYGEHIPAFRQWLGSR